jgi:hypothetical protein
MNEQVKVTMKTSYQGREEQAQLHAWFWAWRMRITDAEIDDTVVEPARGEDTQWCREYGALDDKVGEEIGRSMTEAR